MMKSFRKVPKNQPENRNHNLRHIFEMSTQSIDASSNDSTIANVSVVENEESGAIETTINYTHDSHQTLLSFMTPQPKPPSNQDSVTLRVYNPLPVPPLPLIYSLLGAPRPQRRQDAAQVILSYIRDLLSALRRQGFEPVITSAGIRSLRASAAATAAYTDSSRSPREITALLECVRRIISDYAISESGSSILGGNLALTLIACELSPTQTPLILYITKMFVSSTLHPLAAVGYYALESIFNVLSKHPFLLAKENLCSDVVLIVVRAEEHHDGSVRRAGRVVSHIFKAKVAELWITTSPLPSLPHPLLPTQECLSVLLRSLSSAESAAVSLSVLELFITLDHKAEFVRGYATEIVSTVVKVTGQNIGLVKTCVELMNTIVGKLTEGRGEWDVKATILSVCEYFASPHPLVQGAAVDFVSRILVWEADIVRGLADVVLGEVWRCSGVQVGEERGRRLHEAVTEHVREGCDVEVAERGIERALRILEEKEKKITFRKAGRVMGNVRKMEAVGWWKTSDDCDVEMMERGRLLAIDGLEAFWGAADGESRGAYKRRIVEVITMDQSRFVVEEVLGVCMRIFDGVDFLVELLGHFGRHPEMIPSLGAVMSTCSLTWGARLTVCMFSDASVKLIIERVRSEGWEKWIGGDLAKAALISDRIATFVITNRDRGGAVSNLSGSASLFTTLLPAISHDIASTLSLCIRCRQYDFALRVLSSLSDSDVTPTFLFGLRRLVLLLEMCETSFGRGRMVWCKKMRRVMSSLLIIYPIELEGYSDLRERVTAVSRVGDDDDDDEEKTDPVDENAMWKVFDAIRACHKANRWREIRRESFEMGGEEEELKVCVEKMVFALGERRSEAEAGKD